jgi:hypothetical protein
MNRSIPNTAGARPQEPMQRAVGGNVDSAFPANRTRARNVAGSPKAHHECMCGFRLSVLGLSEEAVELAAGGVEGALLVFPAVVDQRAAVLMDHVADKLFRRSLS